MGTVLYNLIVTPIETVIDLVFMAVYCVTKSPGIAILFVSLVLNFSVLPLYKKADDVQEAERLKQKEMEPWVTHIKNTFKGDERYMMQQAYYREAGYKPLYAIRGSISLFFQIPFFMAAYNYLSKLEILQESSFWIFNNLSEPDGLIKIGTVAINLLPILMTGFNVISSVIYTRGLPLRDKLQTYILASVFLVILYNSPSGLVFYWTLNQIFSLLKNVFLKLIKNPFKVLSIIFAAVGVFAVALSLIKRTSVRPLIFFTVLAFGLACFIPVIIYELSKVIKAKNIEIVKLNPENKKTERTLFYTCSIVMTLLMGIVIPMSVLSSSPIEFSTVVSEPFDLLIHTLSLYAGFFLVWINVFYLLGSEKFKHILTYVYAGVSVVCGVNFFFFAKHLGSMSATLRYEHTPSFSTSEIILSLAVAVLLFSFVLFLMKKKEVWVKSFYQVVALALAMLSVFNCVSTGKVLRDEREFTAAHPPVTSEDCELIPISRNGKNVFVIMLDRALDVLIPYLFEEKPELYDMFDGFTYYPNTLSYGGHTNFATPALFGGYDYTPEEINKRDNDSLCQKQNEALTVLPKIFGENGYKTTVIDPPYAGYRKGTADLSIYNDCKNTSAYNIQRNTFIKDYPMEENALLKFNFQKNGFFYYSIMKALPTLFHNYVYRVYTFLYSKQYPPYNNFFLDQYEVIENLPEMTTVSDSSQDTLLVFQNFATHDPTLLDVPSYTPAEKEVKDYGNASYEYNGKKLNVSSNSQLGHYQVNMAVLLKVGEWLDYLKKNGAYDNTRIIIIADHGYPVDFLDEMVINDEIDVERFNPLLMVKDFNAHGFKTDNSFMTCADVPTLATDGIIKNPVNPYTGNAINSNEKNAHPQLITTSENHSIVLNNGNTFDTSDGAWWSVKDNIFDASNWVRIGDGEKGKK